MKQPKPTDWVFPVSHEALSDDIVRIRTGYVQVHTDFELDIQYFAIWFLAPFVLLYFWWLKHRWMIERWLRWRVADLPAGIHCRYWFLMLRAPKNWTLKRLRPHTHSTEYAAVKARWSRAIKEYDAAELKARLSV